MYDLCVHDTGDQERLEAEAKRLLEEERERKEREEKIRRKAAAARKEKEANLSKLLVELRLILRVILRVILRLRLILRLLVDSFVASHKWGVDAGRVVVATTLVPPSRLITAHRIATVKADAFDLHSARCWRILDCLSLSCQGCSGLL